MFKIKAILFGLCLSVSAAFAQEAPSTPPQEKTPTGYSTGMLMSRMWCARSDYIEALMISMDNKPLFRGADQVTNLNTQIWVHFEENKGIKQVFLITTKEQTSCVHNALKDVMLNEKVFQEMLVDLFSRKA